MTKVIYGDLYPTLPRGGSVEIAITQSADNLNILANTLGAISWMADPVHDFLERYDHEGNLVPSLAESMEFVDDTTLRYVLREATFHNGRAVQAQDVADTIAWVVDPANASARASVFEGVTVNVVDERTVELVLPAPDAGFRHHLPRIPIVPIEEAGSLAEAPVGCGPFIFSEWVRDSHLVYERNPDYWNPEAPRLDTLRIATLSDVQVGSSGFLAGQYDFLSWVDAGQAADFDARAEAGEFEVGRVVPGWFFLAMNHDVEPFDNPLVNKAMGLALDRQAIASVIGPTAVPIVAGPLAPNHPWFLEFPVERDLDGARAALEEAGFGGGIEGITIRAIDDTTERIAVVIQSNLAEIGIQVQVEKTDIPTYVEQRTSGDYQAYVSGWFTTPEPAFVLNSIFITDASANYWNYSNEEVDAKLAEAQAIIGDDDARRELYHEVMRIAFVEDPAMLALATQAETYAYRSHTNGDQYRPDPGPLFHYPIVATTNA